MQENKTEKTPKEKKDIDLNKWSNKLQESSKESFEEWKKDNGDVRKEALEEKTDKK